MKCVLHIGGEKTGSTAIQIALVSHAEYLAEERIYTVSSAGYPNAIHLALSSMAAEKNDYRLTRLGLHSPRKRRRWVRDLYREIFKEIEGVKFDISSCVFSSEHLQSRLGSFEEISSLKSRLQEIGFTQFIVVVYLRRQVDVAVSRFSTALRAGYASECVLPRLGESLKFYSYDSMLEVWGAVFERSEIVVRTYEQAHASSDGLVGDFLSTIGLTSLPNNLKSVAPAMNAALSADAQRILILLNRALAGARCSKELAATHRRKVARVLEESCVGSPMLPSRDAAIRFQEQFTESNDRLSAEWFGGESVFSRDFCRFPVDANFPEYSERDLLFFKIYQELLTC